MHGYLVPQGQYQLRELNVAVLVPNVRGSSGYGKTYLQLDNGFKRKDSVKDIGALLDWIATQPMRDELERVLAYAQIVPRLAFYQLSAADVLAHFDARARLLPVPAKAPVTCSDADDQMFIDLAVAQRSTLLSKDKAVTSMARRLLALGVNVKKAL